MQNSLFYIFMPVMRQAGLIRKTVLGGVSGAIFDSSHNGKASERPLVEESGIPYKKGAACFPRHCLRFRGPFSFILSRLYLFFGLLVARAMTVNKATMPAPMANPVMRPSLLPRSLLRETLLLITGLFRKFSNSREAPYLA